MDFSKYELLVGCFLLITACTCHKEIGEVEVTLRHLDNDKCTAINLITGKKAVFLDREENEQDIKGIVLHYSVFPNADGTEDSFYSRAVSSHLTLISMEKFLSLSIPNILLSMPENLLGMVILI